MSKKLTDIEILEYVDGTLDPEDLDRVEKMLAADDEAQKTAAQMRTANDALQQINADLAPTRSFEEKFKAKQASMETDSASKVISYSPEIVSKAKNSNFFKPMISIAACLGLVFVLSDEIVQLGHESWRGKIIQTDGILNAAPKTRSSNITQQPTKQIAFSTTSKNTVELKVNVFGAQNEADAGPGSNVGDFIIYKAWVRDAAEYFGFSLGDRLTIEIGQRISFNIAASTAGSLSFEINSKNSPQLNIYENKEVKKGDTLTTRSFEAEPPEDHGEFILNFTSSDGQTDILRIPFELREK